MTSESQNIKKRARTDWAAACDDAAENGFEMGMQAERLRCVSHVKTLRESLKGSEYLSRSFDLLIRRLLDGGEAAPIAPTATPASVTILETPGRYAGEIAFLRQGIEMCALIAEVVADDCDEDTPGGYCSANTARHIATRIRAAIQNVPLELQTGRTTQDNDPAGVEGGSPLAPKHRENHAEERRDDRQRTSFHPA